MPQIQEVELIEGERWTFRVHSRSRPGTKWRVDLEAYEWNGACDCENFNFAHEPDLKRGAKASDDFRCYHILTARSYVMEEVLPKLARAMDGPTMINPGEGKSTVARAKAEIKSISNLGALVDLRQTIDARIEEITDEQKPATPDPEWVSEPQQPDSSAAVPEPSPEPQRAAPKIYNLENRSYAPRPRR